MEARLTADRDDLPERRILPGDPRGFPLRPQFRGLSPTSPAAATSTACRSLHPRQKQGGGLKIDLFNGKLTGTVSAFNIKRTNSPIFYWWAPTSNRSRFDPNRNIVYQVNEFRPSSLGGPSWTNGAGQASLSQWNAGLAAGTVYQVAGSSNWYVNASSATGAAFLDSVFNFTKANGFSWPGWLYNTDANTNSAWDNRASGPDGNDYVLGADTSKGWDTQLMFTPTRTESSSATLTSIGRRERRPVFQIAVSPGSLGAMVFPEHRLGPDQHGPEQGLRHSWRYFDLDRHQLGRGPADGRHARAPVHGLDQLQVHRGHAQGTGVGRGRLL